MRHSNTTLYAYSGSFSNTTTMLPFTSHQIFKPYSHCNSFSTFPPTTTNDTPGITGRTLPPAEPNKCRLFTANRRTSLAVLFLLQDIYNSLPGA